MLISTPLQRLFRLLILKYTHLIPRFQNRNHNALCELRMALYADELVLLVHPLHEAAG